MFVNMKFSKQYRILIFKNLHPLKENTALQVAEIISKQRMFLLQYRCLRTKTVYKILSAEK